MASSTESLDSINGQDAATAAVSSTQRQSEMQETGAEHALEMFEATSPENDVQSTQEANSGGPGKRYKGLATKEHAQEVARKFTEHHKIVVDEKERDLAAWLYWSKGEALGDDDFPPDKKKIFEDGDELPFFRQAYSLRTAVLFVGVWSATCQGWYQSVIASTSNYMIKDFQLIVNNPTLPACKPGTDPGAKDCSVNIDLWIVGGLASATSLAAGLLGLLLSDPLQNYVLGRRKTITFAACFSIIGTICLLFVDGPAGVIGLRSLIGFSLGMKASVIPPFLSEITPKHLRGKTLAVWQLGDAFGIFIGFICWVIVEKAPFQSDVTIFGPPGFGGRPTSITGTSTLSDRAKWKILSILPLISTIPLLFTTFVIPESPIFLLKTRKYNEALDSAVKYAPNSIHGMTNFLAFHFEMATETHKSEEQKEPHMDSSKARTNVMPVRTPSECSDNQPTNAGRSSTQPGSEQPNTEIESLASQDIGANAQAGPSGQDTGQDQSPQKLLLGECDDKNAHAKPANQATSKQIHRKKGKSPMLTEESEQGEEDSENVSATNGDETETDDTLAARFHRLGIAIVDLFHLRKRAEPCPHHYHMRKRHFYKFFDRLVKLFSDPRCRRATLSCVLVMVAQASCSINAFAFFTTPLVDKGIAEGSAIWAGLGFGAVSFFMGLLVLALTDRHGRTTLLLSGLPFLVLFSFILGAAFKISDEDTRTRVVMFFAFCFTGIYSFTLGPAAFSLAAESYPASVREMGMALCVFFNMTALGLQLLVYPFITAGVGYSTSFCIYGTINVLATVLCFFFTVDTQNQSLDELQSTFEKNTCMHCKYRSEYVLPRMFGALRINLKTYWDFAMHFFVGKPRAVCQDIELLHERMPETLSCGRSAAGKASPENGRQG